MGKLIIKILVAFFTVVGLAMPIQAKIATKDEALTVANNWINIIIELKGDWDGAETAMVEEVQEFKRGRRVLGYFCRVHPKGYIVVSLRKELAPVKFYSATSAVDPEAEEGMADLIKDSMERILDSIEQQFGPIESVRTQDLQSILEIDYRKSWDELGSDVETFKAELESGVIAMNYQQGQELLTSSWHQGDPYNQDCPAPSPGDDCTAARCPVGCSATAGSQIMRHWAWPPYGVSPYNDTYDWVMMPDTIATTSPQTRIDAVAELCHEMGVAAGMNYCVGGTCQSSAGLFNSMTALTDNFRYSSLASREERRLYSSTAAWYNTIKTQLNLNRPVLYEIPGHAIVVDGWQEIGSPTVQEVHVNFGWGGNSDGWYTLDYDIPGSDPNWQWEKIIINTVPDVALGSSLSGTYSRNASFPYRYFDRDATGNSATFAEGQNLQFLPRSMARCTSSTGGYIRFVGTSSSGTRLFSIKGTAATARVAGARIYNGGMRFYKNGGVRFH
jgi:hypothetical protein